MEQRRSFIVQPKSRKSTLDFSFTKSAPPRPAATKVPLEWRGHPEIPDHNARRQIFNKQLDSSPKPVSQMPLAAKDMSSSRGHGIVSQNAEHNMDAHGHPAKRRRGTPKRAPLISGDKENSSVFRERDDLGSSPAAAKSLFAPLSHEAQQRKLAAATTSIKLFNVQLQEDPWETARNLSPEQQRYHYWKLCYGSSSNDPSRDTVTSGWSARRAQPLKGCLAGSSENSILEHDKFLAFSPSFEEMTNGPYATPKSSPRYKSSTNRNDLCQLRVEFGPPQAAEYQTAEPASTLKPLPPAEAALLYPMEEPSPTEAEASLLQETKENTAMLEGWEDEDDASDDSENMGFSLTHNSDDSSEEGVMPSEIPRIPIPMLPNRKRRSSAFFKPSGENNSLLDDSEEDEKSDISTDVEDQLTPPSCARNDNMCASTLVNLPGLSLESPESSLQSSSSMESPGSSLQSSSSMESPDLSIGSTASTIERALDDSIETVPGGTSLSGGREWLSSPMENMNQVLQDDNVDLVSNLDNTDECKEQASGLLWSTIADKMQALKNTSKKGGNQETVFLDAVIRWAKSIKEDKMELFKFAKNQTMVAEREASQIRRSRKPLSGLSSDRKRLLYQRVKARLISSIQKLENHVEAERARLSALKQKVNMQVELAEMKKDIELCNGMEELVPVQSDFLSDGTYQVTFNSHLLGISLYAPGKTVKILSDLTTAKVLRINLVEMETNTLSSKIQNQTCKIQLECKSILERELEGISTRELDCSETVTHLLIFLSWLGRHFQLMSSSNSYVC